jgi:hypothetical protein
MGQTGVACTLPIKGGAETGPASKNLSDPQIATAGPTCFKQVPAVGAGGIPTKLPNFLNITSGPRLLNGDATCPTVNNHYCH